MEAGNEIKDNIENIKYYTTTIRELVQKQFDNDITKGEKLGVNTNPGTLRYDSLAIIHNDCDLILLYLENMQVNLKTAIKQDKILYSDEGSEQNGLF